MFHLVNNYTCIIYFLYLENPLGTLAVRGYSLSDGKRNINKVIIRQMHMMLLKTVGEQRDLQVYQRINEEVENVRYNITH